MEFKEEFVKKLELEINGLLNSEDIFDNVDKITLLEKYMSIYKNINSVIIQNDQLEIFNQIKDVDFSKVDFNDLLNNLGSD